MTLLGRVGQVWVFPVKSMTGSLLDAVDLDAGGLVGDRAWGVGCRVDKACANKRLRLVGGGVGWAEPGVLGLT